MRQLDENHQTEIRYGYYFQAKAQRVKARWRARDYVRTTDGIDSVLQENSHDLFLLRTCL